MNASAKVRHGIGEWLGAIIAAVTVGAIVGLGCACVIAICAVLSAVSYAVLRVPICAIGALAGVTTVAYFLRLFSSGEIEARDIWKLISKFWTAFGREAPWP
jgi:hypothetical protein